MPSVALGLPLTPEHFETDFETGREDTVIVLPSMAADFFGMKWVPRWALEGVIEAAIHGPSNMHGDFVDELIGHLDLHDGDTDQEIADDQTEGEEATIRAIFGLDQSRPPINRRWRENRPDWLRCMPGRYDRAQR